MARPNPRYGDPTADIRIPTTPTPTPPPQTTPTQTPTSNPKTNPVIVTQGGAVNAQGGTRGQPNPKPEPTECWEVYGNKLELTQAAVDYYKNIGVNIKKCGSAPTPTNGNLEQRVAELEQLSWTYPEVIGTASQRSNVDVWNHLSQWVWGHAGDKWQAGGSAPQWDQPEPSALLPMTLRLHTEQESRLTNAKNERLSLQSKIGELYDKKADKGHSHGGGNGTDWGVVVMGVLAIVVILIIVKYLFPLLKGLKGIIPSRGEKIGGDYGWE